MSSAVFCAWRGAQPFDIHKGPRMVPWRFLMLFSAALTVPLLVHVLGLVRAQNGG